MNTNMTPKLERESNPQPTKQKAGHQKLRQRANQKVKIRAKYPCLL